MNTLTYITLTILIPRIVIADHLAYAPEYVSKVFNYKFISILSFGVTHINFFFFNKRVKAQ